MYVTEKLSFISKIIFESLSLFKLDQFSKVEKFLFFTQIKGKIRRFFVTHFRKRYILEQQEKRQGSCNQCGACCSLLYTCPFLLRSGKCVTYGHCRPEACEAFPIDEHDVQEISSLGQKCGFSFNTPSELQ